MFAAAGRFQSLLSKDKASFHSFMGMLWESTQWDGNDQDAAGFYAWSGDRAPQARVEALGRNGEMIARASALMPVEPEWQRLELSPCKMYLCHARGAMSDTFPLINNHPFIGNNVALMHEGWVSHHRDVARERGLFLTSNTDSELYMRIADQRRPPIGDRKKWSPIECMGSMLDLTDEPTALCFIDHSSRYPHTYFGMNKDGNHPFTIIRYPKYNGIFLVSSFEMWMIAIARDNGTEQDFEVLHSPEPFDVCKFDWRGDSLEVFHRQGIK